MNNPRNVQLPSDAGRVEKNGKFTQDNKYGLYYIDFITLQHSKRYLSFPYVHGPEFDLQFKKLSRNLGDSGGKYLVTLERDRQLEYTSFILETIRNHFDQIDFGQPELGEYSEQLIELLVVYARFRS